MANNNIPSIENLMEMNIGDVFDGWKLLDFSMEEYPCGVACCGYAETRHKLLSPSGEEVTVTS
jgi:hypothetical protein